MNRAVSTLMPALLMAVLALAGPEIRAQDSYPSKPVHVVVPTAPGGAVDLQARLFAQKIAKPLNQSFVIENRAGNTGTLLAVTYVAHKVPADGYTLYTTASSITTLPALYEKPPVDPVKDFEFIALLSKAPYSLVAGPSLPAKNIKEFFAYARANPGKVNFGLSGVRGTIHLGAVWMEDAGEFKMTMVPYKGAAPAMQDLMAGRVDVAYANVISVASLVKSGKLRQLGVTTAERSPGLPDVPTFAESGLTGFDVSTWHGWLAPRGTPAPVVNLLNSELNKALKQPDVVRFLVEDGGFIVGGPPEVFRKLVIAEIERWKRIVQIAGIKPEAE